MQKENTVTFLLGAGCSIASGCMGSSKLVYEFKKRIFCAKYGINYNETNLISESSLEKEINTEFEEEKISNPYSFYFEKCFPNQNDRSIFIKQQFEPIKPSYGYLCFANYLIKHNINHVLTTNFDKLIERSIRKIDEYYDVSVTSDSLAPHLDSQLNIVKLHGDYTYDQLHNTIEEMERINPILCDNLLKISTKRIVVIGYSGQDTSIMNFLSQYIEKFPTTEIFWCRIDCHSQNSTINNLLEKNSNSGYVEINGFDELFKSYYDCYEEHNKIIDEIIYNDIRDNFPLSLIDQKEKIATNAYPIQNDPKIFKIKYPIDSNRIKTINDSHEIFLESFGENVYGIGDKKTISNVLNILESSISIVSLFLEEELNLSKKCKLLKEIIKLSEKEKGLSVFKDNIFKDNESKFKEGLKISVDVFQGKICLFINYNYFLPFEKINDKDNFSINMFKSGIHANINYEKTQILLKNLSMDTFEFNFGISALKFSSFPFTNNDNSELLDNYNCSEEPKMICNKTTSENQIQILNENGPRETLFTPKEIKIGVFCAEEDKPKFNSYLNNLIFGTKFFETKNIPQFKGFESIFKKKINILFDILPKFYARKIQDNNCSYQTFTNFCFRGIKRMYDENYIDLAFIFIGNDLTSFRLKDDFDLHNRIKLMCLNKYKTQFFEESTIDSADNINKILFNLSIGIYTKTIGMPWYPEKYSKDTFYLGISFGVDPNGITVGCSQMFDGAGRGMQLIVTKISDKHRYNQFFSYDEAYELGIKIRQTYYKTSKTDEIKRIVIHRCDPFKKEEIFGFKKAFEGIDDFDLIEISDYTQLNAYRFVKNKCFGYPVARGTTLKASRDTMFIWTDGSIFNSIIPNSIYRNNTRGMGKPLKIKKHYGAITANEVADDLMFLTKMDFNSSDVIYSRMPVTIKYSRIVCDLLKQGKIDEDLISFEYIM